VYSLAIRNRECTIDDESIETIFRVHIVAVGLAIETLDLIRWYSWTAFMDLAKAQKRQECSHHKQNPLSTDSIVLAAGGQNWPISVP
jgi:hypothetical protein